MREPLEHQLQELWKVRDLAAYLKTTPAAIYPLVQRNGIPHIKLGRSLRFDPAAIRHWLASRSRSGKQPSAEDVEGPPPNG